MPDKLKKGWRSWRFDQMAYMVNDRIDDPSEANVEHYIGLEHLDSDSLTIRRWGSPSDVEATKLCFRKGDIIFGRRRVYQRKLAVAPFDGICSAHAMVLRPITDVVLPEFLPFFMQSDLFMERAKQISVGSLSPTINWKTLAAEEFALPPLDEQRRIAEVLNGCGLARESLLIAIQQALRIRKSMLRMVFQPSDSTHALVTVHSLVQNGDLELKTGPFGTVLSAKEYTAVGWPIINPTDMNNGRIDHRDGPCVDDATASRLEVFRLKKGDVLLARKADLSKAVLADREHEGWIGGSDTIRLRCVSDRVLPGYLHLALQTDDAARMLHSFAHGTVMPGLNEKALGRIAICLRCDREQKVIMDRFRCFNNQERMMIERERACAAFGRIVAQRFLAIEGGTA